MARRRGKTPDPETDLDLLPDDLRTWARSEDWTQLRPIQRKVWDWFRNGGQARDLIVCAPTATGKTEAVFLPLVSELKQPDDDGFDLLYICPLKALIDQQGARLTKLLKLRSRKVTRWHGDVRSGRVAAERKPEGMLIITPESMEWVLRQPYALKMFKSLQAIVIDELHAFFDVPRGVQIVAQMARIELLVGRRVPRMGLSATLSEEAQVAASQFLRPADPQNVAIVTDDTPVTPISYFLEAFTDHTVDLSTDAAETSRDRILQFLRKELAAPLQRVKSSQSKRSAKTLVFCNSRALVEFFATELRSSSAPDRTNTSADLSAIVFPHHGSLHADERKKAEQALKNPEAPAVVICSPTLELGLDIGDIEHVVQVDAGPTVSSLRQRLGRSGRRAGKLARLSMLIRETSASHDTHPLAQLHVTLAQALSQLLLVQHKGFETSDGTALHLSTFLQQVVSMAQNEVSSSDIRTTLLKTGPFTEGARDSYELLLRRLSRENDDRLSPPPLLSVQEPSSVEKVYRLALSGRELVSDPGFGAAFNSGRQYVMKAGNETLGTLPFGHGLSAGDPVYFSGRRWAVQRIVEYPATVVLRPAKGGRPPRFTGSPIAPSGLVVATMRDLYQGRRKLPECDLGENAQRLWAEARKAYRKLGLPQSQLLPLDDDVILFPWCGSRIQGTLVAALRYLGFAPAPAHVAIVVSESSMDAVLHALKAIARWEGLPTVEELVRTVNSARIDKHDFRLGPVLERRNYASARFDAQGAKRVALSMLKSQVPSAS